MTAVTRELARQLFVLATELSEASLECALAGQSPQLDVEACTLHAQQLAKLAQDLQITAEMLQVLAARSQEPSKY